MPGCIVNDKVSSRAQGRELLALGSAERSATGREGWRARPAPEPAPGKTDGGGCWLQMSGFVDAPRVEQLPPRHHGAELAPG